jgi:hypothetical protein
VPEPGEDRYGAITPERALEGGGEPLEVHRGGREERLDPHILQSASDGACEAVPALGVSMKTFRAPAVALVEVRIAL